VIKNIYKIYLLPAKNILSYTEGYDYDMFLEDKKTQDAVIRNIEIIGEAAKNVSESLKSEYSEIPWKEIDYISIFN